jgi:hypothetical protein
MSVSRFTRSPRALAEGRRLEGLDETSNHASAAAASGIADARRVSETPSTAIDPLSTTRGRGLRAARCG